LTAIFLVSFAQAAFADQVSSQNGGDTFLAGRLIDQSIDTKGDIFISARSARIKGDASGDMHVSGFDVSVDVNVAEDLYAMLSLIHI